MKKWMELCLLFTLMVMVGCQKTPKPELKNEVKIKLGIYENDAKGEELSQKAYLELFKEDEEAKFVFSPAMISSNMYEGTYEIIDDELVLHDEIHSLKIYFTVKDHQLEFNKEKSSEINFIKDKTILNLKEKNYETLLGNNELYHISQTELNETVDIQINSQEISKIKNKVLMMDGDCRVILKEITPIQDNYVVCLEFRGEFLKDKFNLLTIESMEEGTKSEKGKVYLYTTISNADTEPRHWNGYDVLPDGILLTYQLFRSDVDKEKAKNEDFTITLKIEDMVMQTWSQKN